MKNPVTDRSSDYPEDIEDSAVIVASLVHAFQRGKVEMVIFIEIEAQPKK